METPHRVGGQPCLPPGFRFFPTDEELVVHYLKKKASSSPLPVQIIAEINLYKFDPWDLPGKATFGENEWYFFSPRDRKYPNGARPNRAAGSGYWKATGTDKPILTCGGTQKVGVKKALVFYKGRPPKGAKTDWIMHEYRLLDDTARPTSFTSRKTLRLDDWVLCRIYNKSNHSHTAARAPSTATEPEEASCDAEVLASLPDVEDPMPHSSPNPASFSGLLGESAADTYINSFLTEGNSAYNSDGRPSILYCISSSNHGSALIQPHHKHEQQPVQKGAFSKLENMETNLTRYELPTARRLPLEYYFKEDGRRSGLVMNLSLAQRCMLQQQQQINQDSAGQIDSSAKSPLVDMLLSSGGYAR